MVRSLLYALFVTFSLNSFAQITLPGKFEAENFSAKQGVGMETTTDTDGGQDVGWIPDSGWMEYNVQVATAGIYTFRFRLANGFSDNATLQLKAANGSVLTQFVVPRTGGMQSWKTVSVTVTLPAGNQTLRLFALKGVFSVNWIDVSGSKPLPGKIEAENYDAISDVRPETTQDIGGGQDMGYIDDGDWLDYNVNVASAGSYTVNFRVANSYGNGLIEFRNAAGVTLGQVSIPRTYGWQTWTTVSTTVILPAGSQILKVFATRGSFNFNWFEVIHINALPGKFEAENYDAKQGVGTEVSADTDGGLDVGWIGDNGWMDYNVQVATAGIYTFRFRLANGFSDNATLQLKAANGSVLSQFVVPRTGGMQTWKTVGVTVALPAGAQTLRLYALAGVFSINWVDVSGSKSLPGRIEAENYDAISNVMTETTQDTGGGLNVGGIDDGDWMDYNVNVASAGNYTVNFRVANKYGDGLIEFKNALGVILGQASISRTNDWQNWTTVSTTVSLVAGSQVLRIYANRGDFNLNWFEVLPAVAVPLLPKGVITFASLPQKTVGDAASALAATSTNTQTRVMFVSSNPQIATVSNASGSWQVTPVAAGTATITASQGANTSFAAADNVVRTQVVQASQVVTMAPKITLDPKRWYQLTNASYGLDQLFDGVTNVNVLTGWGKVLDNYDAYYPLLDGEKITLDAIKFFDFEGVFKDKPMTLSVITDKWQRIPVATFTGEVYNGWVGPYPGRTLSGNALFKLDAPVSNIRYLVLNIQSGMPTEMELYGSYTPPTNPATPAPLKAIKLNSMFGVNAFEWNVEDGNTPWQVSEQKMNMVKSFTGFRHYMDWGKLESAPGIYSYNPTLAGGWNYDAMYQRCKDANIEVLACLKTLPGYMIATYPADQQDSENVPVRYGKDFADPLSYIEQAKVGFQYAARYGRNTLVNPDLLSVNQTPRWTGDTPNSLKIGLDLIKYIECDNERDKWWKGRKGYQTAREYAANLSAFYDGHKNTMGPGVGVKNADPTMKVVIAGLVAGPEYVRGMIDWCKEFRGYKPDGTVNLCWDIINFHIYTTDDATLSQTGSATRGAAPEVTPANLRLSAFVQMAHDFAYDMPVWITEAGYDVAQTSPFKAIPIGNKTALQTQADWILRTCLFSARLGIEKLFFYEMYDDNAGGGVFGSSGLIESSPTLARRPAADFMFQTNKLFGDYVYKETISKDPIVDRYETNGKSMYAIVVPDEKGRTAPYTLNLGTGITARIYRPKAGANDMDTEDVSISGGKVTLTATETPLFVTLSPISGARTAQEISERTDLNTTVKIYPNPTADFITVTQDNNATGNLELTLFDASLGRMHKQLTLKKNEQAMMQTIDLSDLPTGVYIIELKQGNERSFRKLVKEN